MSKTKNSFDIYIYILIISLVGGHIGGALTPPRLMAIILFLPLLKAYKAGADRKLRRLICLSVLLEFYSFITLLWTPDLTNGIKELVYFPIHVLLFVEVVVFFRLSNRQFETMINSWTIAFLLTAIVAVWEITTDNHLSQSIIQSGSKVNYGNGLVLNAQFASVTFGNPNTYVTFLTLLVPILLLYTSKWAKGIKMIFSYAPIAISLYILIVNGSRGGVVSALICVTVFIFFKLSSGRAKISFVGVSSFIVFLFYKFWGNFSFYLTHRLSRGLSFSNSGRDRIWRIAWEVLKKYYYFGTGVGGINAAYEAANSPLLATHSMIVEFAMEFGLLAGIVLCVLLLKYLINGLKDTDDNVKLISCALLLSLPFTTIIDSGYFNNPFIWAYAGTYFYVVTKSAFEIKTSHQNEAIENC